MGKQEPRQEQQEQLRRVFFAPGKLGIVLNNSSGLITKVAKGGQVSSAGVQEGWHIRLIDQTPYNLQFLQKKAAGETEYSLAFSMGKQEYRCSLWEYWEYMWYGPYWEHMWYGKTTTTAAPAASTTCVMGRDLETDATLAMSIQAESTEKNKDETPKGAEPDESQRPPQQLQCLPVDCYDEIVTKHRHDISDLAALQHSVEAWSRCFKQAGDGTTNPDMAAIRKLRQLIWLQTVNAAQGFSSGRPYFSMPPVSLAAAETRVVDSVLNRAATPGSCSVMVMQQDMLEAAGALCYQGYTVAVLNMACASSPGGGVKGGAGAQEENLHRRSDAYRFLEEQRSTFYPISDRSCLLSPGVTVFRGTEKDGYPFLEKPFQVTMISCAAVSHPPLTNQLKYANERDRSLMELKIRLMVEAAVQAGCDATVLSAFGCGAFGNPPEQVAQMFYDALSQSPIQRTHFCIFDDHNAGGSHNPCGNFAPFEERFMHGGD